MKEGRVIFFPTRAPTNQKYSKIQNIRNERERERGRERESESSHKTKAKCQGTWPKAYIK